MDRNKIIIAVLLVIIAILACSMAFNTVKETSSDNATESGGTTFNPIEEISRDNTVALDGISFNTTNATDFIKTSEKNDSSYQMSYYTSENGTGSSYVNVLDFGGNGDATLIDSILNAHRNFPSQTIDGITVYTESSSTGEDSSQETFVSVVQNTEWNKIVIFGSPDASETVKMASTLKFD